MFTETTTIQKPKKITLASVKSFIKKNNQDLFINLKSRFDGMVDGCVDHNKGFIKATNNSPAVHQEYTLGIDGAWFVGSSRDYFKGFENEEFTGIEVSNCCGRFIIAVKK